MDNSNPLFSRHFCLQKYSNAGIFNNNTFILHCISYIIHEFSHYYAKFNMENKQQD